MRSILILFVLCGLTSGQIAGPHRKIFAAAPASYTDNFNRANGTVGTNWTVDQTGFHIASNGLVNVTGGFAPELMHWSANSWTDDQYSQIKVVLSAGGTYFVGPQVRGDGDGNGDGYWAPVRNNGTGQLCLSATCPSALGTFSAADGDTVKLSAVGSTITVSVNGVQVVNVTDLTWTTGHAGIVFVGDAAKTTPVADDWSGANQ